MKDIAPRRGALPRLLLLVVAAAAAVVIRQVYVANREQAHRIEFERVMMCGACRHVWGADLDTDAAFPAACPKCGAKAGGFAYVCDACPEPGTSFAYVPEPFTMPTCPICNSAQCSRLERAP